MIERNRLGDELRETFSVLGSTGNVSIDKTTIIRASLTHTQVYTVVIDQMPRCNCTSIFAYIEHIRHSHQVRML